jgi:hypothetical protein
MTLINYGGWQSRPCLWGHVYDRTFMSMEAMSMRPCLWFAVVLYTRRKAPRTKEIWDNPCLVASCIATYHMGSVLIKLYEPGLRWLADVEGCRLVRSLGWCGELLLKGLVLVFTRPFEQNEHHGKKGKKGWLSLVGKVYKLSRVSN